jgi:hypothetical protein
MGIGRFFASDSNSKQPLEESPLLKTSTTSPGSIAAGKSNVVSIVEHRFKRMNEAHDRIRTALFASRWPNSR